MEIIGSLNPGEKLEIKRFYLPGITLKDKCPKCGAEFIDDLGSSHLSYPIVGKEFNYDFYCEECYHEWSQPIILNIEIKNG